MNPTGLHLLFPQALCMCYHCTSRRCLQFYSGSFFFSFYLLSPTGINTGIFVHRDAALQLLWEALLILPHNKLFVTNTLGNMLHLQKIIFLSYLNVHLGKYFFLPFLNKDLVFPLHIY